MPSGGKVMDPKLRRAARFARENSPEQRLSRPATTGRDHQESRAENVKVIG